MNCPKCATPAAAGATHCKRCGSAIGGKAAAKPASSSDEIDLMPLEESKTPAFSAYEPPPGLEMPPPPGGKSAPGAKAAPGGPPGAPGADYVPKIRGANASPQQSGLTKIIGAAVVALILGFIVWRMVRTKSEVVGNAKQKFEQSIQLSAGQIRLENIEVTGVVAYTLDVEMLDGEMIVGVVQRSHKDPQKLADLKKCDPLETLKKGDKKQFTGEFKHKEQSSWMFLNDSKKAARAKVKFQTTPQ